MKVWRGEKSFITGVATLVTAGIESSSSLFEFVQHQGVSKDVEGHGVWHPRRWGGLCLTLQWHHENDFTTRWAKTGSNAISAFFFFFPLVEAGEGEGGGTKSKQCPWPQLWFPYLQTHGMSELFHIVVWQIDFLVIYVALSFPPPPPPPLLLLLLFHLLPLDTTLKSNHKLSFSSGHDL